MTDPSDTWAANWRRLGSRTDRVRARYHRFCAWLMRNAPLPF